MRKGKNIAKERLVGLKPCSHRVIIPLYIPNLEGYYKDSLDIFEMCLKSVSKTAKSPIKISVISNGSDSKINSKLHEYYLNGLIDELILEKENIGKINSILKALRTVEERLVTITDADVLFLDNWEEEVIKVFREFPKAGMVSPVPIFRTHFRHSANIWRDYFFSSKLKFRPVKNPDDMEKFANSLGWSYLHEKLKDVYLTLKSSNNVLAVVGNSHFVGTYKREVFDNTPSVNSKYRLGGNSEELYTDLPVLLCNGYRLATYDNFAYHLGNTKEVWMLKKFQSLKTVEKTYDDFLDIRVVKRSTLQYFISFKLFKKIFYIKRVKKVLLKMKGLNKKQVYNFTETSYE